MSDHELGAGTMLLFAPETEYGTERELPLTVENSKECKRI
jgi:hypothetical protein